MSLIVTDAMQLELPEELAHVILSYWDVPTLVKIKAVCLTWKRLCIAVINDKALPSQERHLYYETNFDLQRSIMQDTMPRKKKNLQQHMGGLLETGMFRKSVISH
jgi:hypothetical protein